MVKECLVCGIFFETDSSRKICSEKCAKERKKYSNSKYYKKNRASILRVCSECGKEFSPNIKHVSICSDECLRKRQPYRHNKKTLYEKTCRCGKKFETESTWRSYCSKKCAKQAHIDKMRIRNKELLFGTETTVVDAKCPGCGIIHKKEILSINVGIVMPRYYCSRYPACSDNFYCINYENAWHSNNRAMI